jgi:phage-related protein
MDIKLLKTANGDCPVCDFLKNLEDQKAHKLIDKDLERIEKISIDELRQAELLTKMPGYGNYNLFEYKKKFRRVQYRILCCIKGSTCHLVHGFIKKSKKTPLSDLGTATQRINNYLSPL